MADPLNPPDMEDPLAPPSRIPCYKQPAIQVMFAVTMGLVLGLGLKSADWESSSFLTGVKLVGSQVGIVWLKALKCVVLPMIILAMIEAMVMMRSLPGASSVASAVLRWYTILPTIAGLEACIWSSLLYSPVLPGNQPGNETGNETLFSTATAATTAPQKNLLEAMLDIITALVPSNLVLEASIDNMLPVIVASLLFGALVRAQEEDGTRTPVMNMVADVNTVVQKVITGIMSITPFAVFSLVFKSSAENGVDGFIKARILASVAALVLVEHFFITFPLVIFFFAKRNPIKYWCNCLPAFLQALGTSSSAATLPMSLRVATQYNGIAKFIAEFVISLGATIGMDGTAIYLICATVFLVTQRGVVLSVGQLVTVAVLSALVAAGSAPIPNASLFLLGIIMKAVGFDITEQEVGIIAGVDWAIDRLRTTVNVAGDQTVAAILDRQFGGDETANGITKEKVVPFVNARKRTLSSMGTFMMADVVA